PPTATHCPPPPPTHRSSDLTREADVVDRQSSARSEDATLARAEIHAGTTAAISATTTLPTSTSPSRRMGTNMSDSIPRRWAYATDRKSTRLNSSHVAISYAV